MKKSNCLAAFITISLFVVVFPASATALSPEERDAAVKYLEETRDAVQTLANGLTEEQFHFRPKTDAWSVAEIVEHLVKVEGVAYDGMTKKLLASPPHPEWRNGDGALIRDHVVKMAVTNREARKFTAPEFVAPEGGSKSRDELVAAFTTARNRTIELARTTDADLRSHFMENPALGMIDGYQWLLFVAAHSERHTIQAREVMANVRFPGTLHPITPEERAALVEDLHRSRKRLESEVDGLTAEQLSFRESPERWSIAQVVEHLARAEELLLTLVQDAVREGEPHPEWKGENGPRVKDLVFVMAITNRETKKFEAPPKLRPTDGFESPAAAFAAFKERRAQTVDYALTVQDDLRAWFRENPGFGSMDAYQWLLLLSAHTDRHIQQIEQIKSAGGYPR